MISAPVSHSIGTLSATDAGSCLDGFSIEILLSCDFFFSAIGHDLALIRRIQSRLYACNENIGRDPTRCPSQLTFVQKRGCVVARGSILDGAVAHGQHWPARRSAPIKDRQNPCRRLPIIERREMPPTSST